MLSKKFCCENKNIPFINEINVAIIMDPFTYNAFNFEFNAIILEPDNWLEKFLNEKIDLLFVESAWHGVSEKSLVDGIALEKIDDPWKGKIHTNLDDENENRLELFQILDFCKKNNIPTVFWNKEDPTSFNDRVYNFVDTALHFDYIFTTDEDIIPKYIEKGHDKVFPLLFAVQLKIFNPIEIQERSTDIIFAGSWYNQYKNRCIDMKNIFNKILKSEYALKIYNRESGSHDPNRQYPKEYQNYLNERVPLNKMASVYKESIFSLNMNTVTNSHTMFARRVYELMASNTFIFSNYSEGISDLFGNNVKFLDLEDNIDLSFNEINQIRNENLYNVLENHTYYQRFKHILNIINFEYREHIKRVFVIYIVNDKNNLKKIIDDFKTLNYRDKICYIISDAKLDISELDLDTQLFKKFCLKHITYLNEILGSDDYFIFRNLNYSIDKDFFNKSMLHFQYIEKNVGIVMGKSKYIFIEDNNFENVLFNYCNLDTVLRIFLNYSSESLNLKKYII